jgi:hypothetical protein
MNARNLSRLFPAIAVVALLCVGAGEPDPLPGPAPPPQRQPPCTDFASAVTGDSTIAFPHGAGVEQALPAGMSVASCSLRVATGFNAFPVVVLRDWDPTTLAPDPNTIALRRIFFDPSSILRARFILPPATIVPPVVTGSVPDLAEPPTPQAAMQLINGIGFWQDSLRVYFTPDGPPELPAAVMLNVDGSRVPLPGPHPVLAHAVCAGDSDLGTLRIAQNVTRTDVKPFPSPREFAQRFRVPQRVELRWIELAMAGILFSGGTYNDPAVRQAPILAVVDGESMPTPVPDMPPPLVQAPIDLNALASAQTFGPVWGSHLDFDRTVTLEPDHDYWIYVREAATSTFLNRRIRGDEPPVFTAAIGPYFCRADSMGDWNRTADQVLAFRIVGRPTASSVANGPPPIPRPAPSPAPHVPAPSAFALSTTPNPAPGPVRVEWSGAVSPVRFEVLDARGRRVTDGTGGAAGTWTWGGTDRDGRAVASGVYFVRARDSAGQLTSQRVMIVR